MRAYVLSFIGAFWLAASIQAAAIPPVPGSTMIAVASTSIPAASHKCGNGQRWVPAGYAKHGKYRAGHCAPA